MLENKNRNESQTRLDLITPALRNTGWDEVLESQLLVEYKITEGRLAGAGKRRNSLWADYVLVYKNQILAVIEAKAEKLEYTEGLEKAKNYADLLQAPFAFATNGHKIRRVDMRTGKEDDIDQYPTPDELWNVVYGESKIREQVWRERFSKIPFNIKGGQWSPRYFQHNAVTKTLDAICREQKRILLTLATGTGKTAIAFQIVWKLFHAHWNIVDWEKDSDNDDRRQPRILFLTDRKILVSQAFNEFSEFKSDERVRIYPDSIGKTGDVPKNANIFFTLFQTIMVGREIGGKSIPIYRAYPPDFFDLIIIDECHRGMANDESRWREIVEYFKPAVHIGLTATPRQDSNVDTYNYFGKPVYSYSLKSGINDGFLTPFKVQQIAGTIDEYAYDDDDEVVTGEIDSEKIYREADFNRIIQIKEREKKRVETFMGRINQDDKTLVFCANQAHASLIRNFINECKTSSDPNYCVRVTADEGDIGDNHLSNFRDTEKIIPTILTTSRKLTTGVDARDVRNIVLVRPVKSMIEFKQIIGRGTRLSDNKDYFTVYDFVNASAKFNDPEWDGDPEIVECAVCEQIPCICAPGIDEPEICSVCGKQPCECAAPEPCPECGKVPCICNCREMIEVKLSEGKVENIRHIVAMSIYDPPSGKIVTSEQFVQNFFSKLPEFFTNEAQLRDIWSHPDTRRNLLSGLAEKGYGEAQLTELQRLIDAEDSDIYDVLAYIAYDIVPKSRVARVNQNRKMIQAKYPEYQQKDFLEFVFGQYVNGGVQELDDQKLPALMRLKYGAYTDGIRELGDEETIRKMFINFQRDLYKTPPT